MEIQNLKLLITEADANELARTVLVDTHSVENLHIRLTPSGVVVEGDYPTFLMKMRFETLWEVTVSGPEVQARLASVKVASVPAGILKGVLMKILQDAVGEEKGVRIKGDSLHVNVEEVARAQGFPLLIRLTAVRCSIGAAVVEASSGL